MHIITGGAGFIGSAAAWRLNEAGIDDILIVDALGTGPKWKNLVGRKYVDFIHLDEFLTMVESDCMPGNIESIIHMGACSATSERDADYLMDNNFHYTVKLAQYSIDKGIRFITASSGATYGGGEAGFSDDDAVTPSLRPINMYGYSKHLFDLWLLRNKLTDKVASLKFFNVFGPNEYHKEEMASVIFHSFNRVRESGRIKLFKSANPDYGDGDFKRDFIYVKDCVETMMWLLENPEVNGIYNLGTGNARSWNDLAKAVFAALGKEPQIEYIEMPEHLRDHYQYFTEAKMDKLRAAGYRNEFTSLEDAAKDYICNYMTKADPYL
ncbi:MAG: ADP-glyceromanno-heptose 6-epimerase [Planctomycetes bacterium]|nr:ADP-glyceromanno-heptose 6-epimerase [Planctomycetota bacterium]